MVELYADGLTLMEVSQRLGSIVQHTATEDNFIDAAERNESARCWPGVIANLIMSLLETGSPLSEIA